MRDKVRIILKEWLQSKDDIVFTDDIAIEEVTDEIIDACRAECTIPIVSVSLTDAEIITWLRGQNYQTEMGEQEYRMYFDVDMPKIIRAAIAHFSLGNER